MNPEVVEEQIHYVPFEELKCPEIKSCLCQSIQEGFLSKEWKVNFQTLTYLRQMNKFFPNLFTLQLLPHLHPFIVQQIDNLRSSNAKEALTLVHEFLEEQKIEEVQEKVIAKLVGILFTKSVSEKGFLKKQALKSINKLSSKENMHLLKQLSAQTQSNNGAISELGIKVLGEYMQNNKVGDVDEEFLGVLAKNIEGKRAVLQKKGKQILSGLKKRVGQEQLTQIILHSKQLRQQQSSLLLKELQAVQEKQPKQQSFKDFIRNKKQTSN